LMSHDDLDCNCVDWYGGTPLDDADREGHSSVSFMIKEAGGLPSADESLKETKVMMQSKREQEEHKSVVAREADAAMDKLRKLMLDKIG